MHCAGSTNCKLLNYRNLNPKIVQWIITFCLSVASFLIFFDHAFEGVINESFCNFAKWGRGVQKNFFYSPLAHAIISVQVWSTLE
jgi:hypothetical protein